MQLSGESFRQIIGQLKGIASSAGKRANPRVGLRNRVLMTPLKGANGAPGQPIYVQVRDLSQNGISLVHHQRMPANTLFAIRLPVYGVRDIMAVYMVRHCEVLDGELFRIGAVLVKVDDPEGIVTMDHVKELTDAAATAAATPHPKAGNHAPQPVAAK